MVEQVEETAAITRPSALKSSAVVFPFLICTLIWFIPAGYELAGLVIYSLLYFNFCIGITFETFMRFSRYKLSHNHPILNFFCNLISLIAPFVGLLGISMALNAYSLLVSPNDPDKEIGFAWHERAFAIPLLQMFVIFYGMIALIYKMGA